MPTTAYLLALKIVPRVKAACPDVVVSRSKTSCVFLLGSALEKSLYMRREIARAKPYWESESYQTVAHWNTSVTPYWLGNASAEIIRREVEKETSIISTFDRPLTESKEQLFSNTINITRAKVWGIPPSQQRAEWFFHRILIGQAKRRVSDSVFRIACTNAHGVYFVQERILKDALEQEQAYRTLYAIHPLLGRAWVPWFRAHVERITGETANSSQYAQQLQSALSAFGVQRSGRRTLHRIAEVSPKLLTSILRQFRYQERFANVPLDNFLLPYYRQTLEMVQLLNFLNGNRPAPAIHFQKVFDLSDDPEEDVPLRNPQDRVVMARLHHWLKADMRFDAQLITDWINDTITHRPGALHRGFAEVTRCANRRTIRHVALAWADRAQRRWHHQMAAQNRDLRTPEERHLTWKPLTTNTTISLSIHGQDWQFVELVTSASLREEGRVMRHCVGNYDARCARGLAHIFSVRDAFGTRVSTLELRAVWPPRAGQKHRYVLSQNRSSLNQPVASAGVEAVLHFVEFANRASAAKDPHRRARS